MKRNHRVGSGQRVALRHHQRLGTTSAQAPPAPRWWSLGSGQQEAGLKRETIAGNNPFLLHVVVHVLQGVMPKFLSPNSFSTMAEITPTTSLVVEIPETRVRLVMRQNTNIRTVIQITKKCTTLVVQCVYTHTHAHMLRTRGHSSLSHWRAKFSGRVRQRKGR